MVIPIEKKRKASSSSSSGSEMKLQKTCKKMETHGCLVPKTAATFDVSNTSTRYHTIEENFVFIEDEDELDVVIDGNTSVDNEDKLGDSEDKPSENELCISCDKEYFQTEFQLNDGCTYTEEASKLMRLFPQINEVEEYERYEADRLKERLNAIEDTNLRSSRHLTRSQMTTSFLQILAIKQSPVDGCGTSFNLPLNKGDEPICAACFGRKVIHRCGKRTVSVSVSRRKKSEKEEFEEKELEQIRKWAQKARGRMIERKQLEEQKWPKEEEVGLNEIQSECEQEEEEDFSSQFISDCEVEEDDKEDCIPQFPSECDKEESCTSQVTRSAPLWVQRMVRETKHEESNHESMIQRRPALDFISSLQPERITCIVS